jgi:hypothetical protein
MYRMFLNLRAGNHAAAAMETILLLPLRTEKVSNIVPPVSVALIGDNDRKSSADLCDPFPMRVQRHF